ncbi:hypothetical protein [Amycolatopsis sp. NPDC051102]|uniref:hypothetical protein n=1 Tax=Amycolatopsis sp. NPDC051102 TaxID=3155163 RepID=UPI00344069CE
MRRETANGEQSFAIRGLAVGDDLGTPRCRRNDQWRSSGPLHAIPVRLNGNLGRSADRNPAQVDLERQ